MRGESSTARWSGVGGRRTIQLDVRVIGAANVDLPSLARYGAFRADLLDRLAFEVVTLPPLRARPVDVTALAHAFALEITQMMGRDVFPGFSPRAEKLLLAHSWPGNVRELKNVVERAVYRSESSDVANRHGRHRPFRQPVASACPSMPAPSTGRPPANPKRPTSPDSTARTHRAGFVGSEKHGDTERGAPAGPSGTGGATTDFTTEVARFERGLLKRTLYAARHNQRETARALGRSDTTSSDGC